MSETTDECTHLTVNIDCMLSSTPSNPSMFRVDDHLRSINRKAYNPVIIAIGPFHRRNRKLKKMEEHKERHLKLLLERRNESVERYVTAIRDLEDKARKCYAEDIKLDRDEFVRMLILDGCFIIEFLHKFQYKEGQDDPIFQYGYIQSHLFQDLMLFENQIPFFIIDRLFHMIYNGSNIKELIWPLLGNGIFPVQELPEVPRDADHLLGIVHDIQCPSLLGHMEPGDSYKIVNINSALELTEAGISFKKLESKDDDNIKSLFYVKFEHKAMKIPEWKISDPTESLFRNLIAYEYYLTGSPKKYVTDYVYFMSCLVHSSEDAKLLRRSGIISNLLGSDEMVYDLINKLSKNINISDEFPYFDIFSKVNSHCLHRRNKWMETLRRNSFNSPWAIISLLAATFLLGLTITQTVFAILSLKQ